MNQNRQHKHDLRAKAFGDALRKGIRNDVTMRACFELDKPLSKWERKHQARIENLLNEGCKEENLVWLRDSKLRAEASRRAFKRGLMLGIKTE